MLIPGNIYVLKAPLTFQFEHGTLPLEPGHKLVFKGFSAKDSGDRPHELRITFADVNTGLLLSIDSTETAWLELAAPQRKLFSVEGGVIYYTSNGGDTIRRVVDKTVMDSALRQLEDDGFANAKHLQIAVSQLPGKKTW